MTYVTIHTNAAQVAKDLDLSARLLKNAMADATREAAKEIRRDFERPVRTWDHQPSIFEEIRVTPSVAEALVGTDDKIFLWLDQGTRRHWIEPVRANALRFLSGYHAKTSPGSLQAGGGGRFGEVRFSKGHYRKGITPRRFTDQIQRRSDKRTPGIFDKHLKRWASRSGRRMAFLP